MDFKVILEKLLVAFEGRGVRYALMGGFAMGLRGGSRSTVGLDFLAHRDDREEVFQDIRDGRFIYETIRR